MGKEQIIEELIKRSYEVGGEEKGKFIKELLTDGIYILSIKSVLEKKELSKMTQVRIGLQLRANDGLVGDAEDKFENLYYEIVDLASKYVSSIKPNNKIVEMLEKEKIELVSLKTRLDMLNSNSYQFDIEVSDLMPAKDRIKIRQLLAEIQELINTPLSNHMNRGEK